MNKQRKQSALIYILTIVSLLMISFSGVAGARTVVNHFNNTAHGLGWLAWLKEMVPKFEAENPDIKIGLTTPSTGGTAETFMVLAASGISIDVSELVVRMGASVASLGGYKDLRPYLQRSDKISLDAYVPIARAGVTRNDGLVWGVPSICMWYRPTTMPICLPRRVWPRRLRWVRAGILTPR